MTLRLARALLGALAAAIPASCAIAPPDSSPEHPANPAAAAAPAWAPPDLFAGQPAPAESPAAPAEPPSGGQAGGHEGHHP